MDRFIIKYWAKDKTIADAVTDNLSTQDLQDAISKFNLLTEIQNSLPESEIGSAKHAEMIRFSPELANNSVTNRIGYKYLTMNVYWQLIDTTDNSVRATNTNPPPA